MKILKRLFLVFLIITFISGLFALDNKFNTSIIDFSTDIFKRLSSTSDKNTFISPISIYLALIISYNGALGQTKKAIEKCIKSININENELNQSGKKFMNSIKNLKDSVTINIANSIWIKNNYQVLNSFIDKNKSFFNAAIKRISMQPSDARLINQWIEEKTNNKIKDMIGSIDPLSRMILINAIYFLGNWEKKFDKDLTKEAEFYLENGKQINVKTMEMSDKFPYLETNEFQVVQLDYKNNKLGLVIVLPKKNIKLSNLLKSLNTEMYKKFVYGLKREEGNIFIPKFKFKYSKNLNPVLKDMGMGIAFSSKADFRGINPMGDLFISLIQHDAFIEINETGTEASAATVVNEVASASPSRKQPFVFKADRPFFYFIIDNENKIPIFMGSLYNPD